MIMKLPRRLSMTAPEKDLIRGDLVHTTLSPPGVPIEHEDLLERFRLENANLRRIVKELKTIIQELKDFIKSHGR